ncbi:MAG: glycosyltransferase [Candidatus Nanoarchaeia archaeon]|nr:glycosyltransferase [Candidatus Nanoarchaeia archaeon]
MNILIIKLGASGDVVRTTFILRGLKKKYSDSKIYWLTKPINKDLLITNPLIHKILVYKKDQIQNIFDLVINLDDDYETAELATKLNTRVIGYHLDKNKKIVPTSTAKEWYDMSLLGKKPMNDILKKKNTKTYQEHMKKILDIECDTEPILELNNEQKQIAKSFRRRYNIKESDTVIGLSTGASQRWQHKSWSMDKTIILAERLYKELNAKIILFGGPEEIERNDVIIARAGIPIINSGCGNNFYEFPAVMSTCDLVITSDSLALHVALALKRKTIVFFGPTSYNEIDIFSLGKKIIPKMPCLVCYKNECNKKPSCMDKITIEEMLVETKKMLSPKLSIVITAFKEEKTIAKAIESIIKQKIDYPYELIVSSPDKPTTEIVNSYSRKYKQVKHFKDPGKGKSFALNLLFKELKGKSDILLFTDGDVFLGESSVNEMVRPFKDPFVGVTAGRVIPVDSKETMFGYWSHLLADAGAHRIRQKRSDQNKFLEASAYIFAFRNNIVDKIPVDVAEDSIIPFYFWKKGFSIRYVPEATVYVKNPESIKEWFLQRKRTANAHTKLKNYEPNFPKVKSFTNEIKEGIFPALTYAKNLKEFYWTLRLILARFGMWFSMYYELKFKNKHYVDGWERAESTR